MSEHASVTILEHVRAIVESTAEGVVFAGPDVIQRRERGIQNFVRVAVEEDASERDRSTLDSEGRVLELDVVIECEAAGIQYPHAKRIASEIERALLEGRGIRHVDAGGRYQIERARETTQTSEDSAGNAIRLTTEYSCLYRIRRGHPEDLL